MAATAGASADDGKGLLLWVAGFAGLLLVYAAYKGTSPLALLRKTASGSSGTAKTPAAGSGTSGSLAGPGDFGAGGSATTGGNGGSFITAPSLSLQDGIYSLVGTDGSVTTIPEVYQHSPATWIPGT